MALTRKMLRAMGIEDEKADEIIEAHAETVDALKQRIADAVRGERACAPARPGNRLGVGAVRVLTACLS
ncbi:MAG: hypothetical protein SOI24_10925 [Coriobacteriales bacterium]